MHLIKSLFSCSSQLKYQAKHTYLAAHLCTIHFFLLHCLPLLGNVIAFLVPLSQNWWHPSKATLLIRGMGRQGRTA
jgi:hypothetical protein